MSNLDLLEKILKSEGEYWMVSKRTSYREYGEWKKGEDDIAFIAIPRSIKRNIDIYDLTLREIEAIKNTPVDTNLFIIPDFTPFQIGQTMASFNYGFEVDVKGINKYLDECKALGSHDIYEYEKLLKKYKS